MAPRGPAAALALLVGAAVPAWGIKSLRAPSYPWPSAHGKKHGASHFMSPENGVETLNESVSWRWHHPLGKQFTVIHGAAIDDHKNVYLSADDAIRKFDEVGKTLWIHQSAVKIPTSPCIADGKLLFTSVDGHITALNMENGAVIWSVKVSDAINDDMAALVANNGVVVVATDADGPQQLNKVVRAVSTDDGSLVWRKEVDAPVYNFNPTVSDDGSSLLFQDIEGRGYKLRFEDGYEHWKRGGSPGTWGAAQALLADEVLYTVTLHGCCCGNCSEAAEPQTAATPGTISAYRVSDGERLWDSQLPRPTNVAPALAVVHVKGEKGGVRAQPRLMVPVGSACDGNPTDLYTIDAQTGASQLYWTAPRSLSTCPGEIELKSARQSRGMRDTCNPNAATAPVVDDKSTVFFGNQDGKFYALRDKNLDLTIDEKETATVDLGAVFSPAGNAHADGMIVATSCDEIAVIKYRRPVGKGRNRNADPW